MPSKIRLNQQLEEGENRFSLSLLSITTGVYFLRVGEETVRGYGGEIIVQGASPVSR